MNEHHSETLTRHTEGCLGEELAKRIEQDIVLQLPKRPNGEHIKEAKYHLQELYHEYRRINPCKPSMFAEWHLCIYQAYTEGYDRLDAFARTVPLAKRSGQRGGEGLTEGQKKQIASDALASELLGIRKEILGDESTGSK